MKLPWVARERLEAAERRAQIAEDRLYAAWKEGHTIPPRESVTQRDSEIIQALPDKLLGYINNWESAETRYDLEREARRLHFEMSFPEERVLELWKRRDNPNEEEAVA